MAFVLRYGTAASPRSVPDLFSSGQPKPVIHVTYTDGTNVDLIARIVASNVP